jgi:hypothetical protein
MSNPFPEGGAVDVTHLYPTLGLDPEQRIFAHIPAAPTEGDPSGFRSLPEIITNIVEQRSKTKAAMAAAGMPLLPAQEERAKQEAYMRKISENSQYGGPRPPRCAKCRAPKPSHQCSKCKRARYCSEACQTSDWMVHKHVCSGSGW